MVKSLMPALWQVELKRQRKAAVIRAFMRFSLHADVAALDNSEHAGGSQARL